MSFESNNDFEKSLLGDYCPPLPEAKNGHQEITMADVDSTSMTKQDFIPLHGDVKPTMTIKNENFTHRLVITLKARGLSNKQIAAELNITSVTVSNVLRQDWARERLAKLIHDSGGDHVKTVLEGACMDSIYKLIDIRDDPKVQPSVQKAACSELLDRYLGKPTQHVEVEQSTTVNHQDIKAIDRELDLLAKEQNRILNNAI